MDILGWPEVTTSNNIQVMVGDRNTETRDILWVCSSAIYGISAGISLSHRSCHYVAHNSGMKMHISFRQANHILWNLMGISFAIGISFSSFICQLLLVCRTVSKNIFSMKKLLIILICLPLAAMAQDGEPADDVKTTGYKNQIGISAGVSWYTPSSPFSQNPGFCGSLSYLHNIRQSQIGLSLEFGSLFYDYNYVAPLIQANKKIQVKKSFFYAGVAAGYYYAHSPFMGTIFNQNQYGYVLGVQGGYALYLNKHFSFTSEIRVRSAQYWQREYDFTPEGYTFVHNANYFTLMLPVSIGFIYRF